MLLHTTTCLFAVRFAFIFVPPLLLLDQLARTRGAAGNSATPFLCYRLCLSFRQFLPPFYPSPTFPPQLSLPPPFSTLPIGPASHCGWSRLSSISPPSLALATTLSHYLGPACHCGRSRLVSPPFYLSTSHIHTTLISITLLTYIPLPLHLFWPGLSLWQVPPTFPTSNTLQHFLPLHPPTITFPQLHLPLRYIVARLVIVAGPAISSYPCTSLTPPSLLFPLPTSTYQPTPPPLQATGPACHCGWSRLSHLPILPLPSIHTPHLLLSYLGPAYHCGRSRPP